MMINGNHVELDEIEFHMSSAPGIKAATACVPSQGVYRQQLVAVLFSSKLCLGQHSGTAGIVLLVARPRKSFYFPVILLTLSTKTTYQQPFKVLAAERRDCT